MKVLYVLFKFISDILSDIRAMYAVSYKPMWAGHICRTFIHSFTYKPILPLLRGVGPTDHL